MATISLQAPRLGGRTPMLGGTGTVRKLAGGFHSSVRAIISLMLRRHSIFPLQTCPHPEGRDPRNVVFEMRTDRCRASMPQPQVWCSQALDLQACFARSRSSAIRRFVTRHTATLALSSQRSRSVVPTLYRGSPSGLARNRLGLVLESLLPSPAPAFRKLIFITTKQASTCAPSLPTTGHSEDHVWLNGQVWFWSRPLHRHGWTPRQRRYRSERSRKGLRLGTTVFVPAPHGGPGAMISSSLRRATLHGGTRSVSRHKVPPSFRERVTSHRLERCAHVRSPAVAFDGRT